MLIEEGIIVPVLDALDELVRGQAREGSRMFLNRLGQSFGPRARGVLSSRDYYLNLDPLVRDELGDRASYLTVGYFNRQGRRRYIQVRTGLSSDHAARWAHQLETQAKRRLSARATKRSPPGRPPSLLDAFCQMIEAIPDAKRANEAATFQLRSPNIFGEILERVLTREHTEKFLPSWRGNGYESQLADRWKDPFTPALQQLILRRIVLMVAQRGGTDALKHSAEDQRYARLRHGLFSFSETEEPLTLQQIIIEELGEPEAEPHVPESERRRCAHAVDVVVEAIRSHTLADTQPDQPKGLVFATRHRAYFDYFLAQAVLDELISSLVPNHQLDENFVLWCIEHNIVEHSEQKEAPPFASCLDFVLWHREELADAVEETARYLGPEPAEADFSEELASYICSLALALLLRYGQQRGGTQLVGFDAASDRQCTISVNADIVPTIKNLRIDSCLFPDLTVDNVDIVDVDVVDSELRSLRLDGALKWERVSLSAQIDELVLGGRAELENCILDVHGAGADNPQLDLGRDTKVTMRGCSLSPVLYERLHDLSRDHGTWLQLSDCKPIEVGTVEGTRPAESS